MSKKVILELLCPCEREHAFQQVFLVKGEGQAQVQAYCPGDACPYKKDGKARLLSFIIPYELVPDETVFRGTKDKKP